MFLTEQSAQKERHDDKVEKNSCRDGQLPGCKRGQCAQFIQLRDS
jgi:hypothetical protein